jgi:hypothetical protein
MRFNWLIVALAFAVLDVLLLAALFIALYPKIGNFG